MSSAMLVKYLLNSFTIFNGSDSDFLLILRVMLALFDFEGLSDTSSLTP